MRFLVVGCRGQDGTLLVERAQRDGHTVVGIDKGVVDGSSFSPFDVADSSQVEAFVAQERPERVFYLAAYHGSSEDADEPWPTLFAESMRVHVSSYVKLLEALVHHMPGARVFYAASSRIFGRVQTRPQNELHPVEPRCAYGISKAAGVFTGHLYRAQRGLFVCSGILYNHESPLRKPVFVTKKIVLGAVKALREKQQGKPFRFRLGDLSAEVDWGYAPDYVDAMMRILEVPTADDFVIATGEAHTVREFVEAAFEVVGLDWQDHVEEDRSLVVSGTPRVGDSTKLREATGWAPSLGFRDMVRTLVEAELVVSVSHER
jgi:GDPmannose 4,6-dehydratase